MRRLFAPPALVTAVAANLGVLGQLNGFERGILAVTTLLLLWDMHALAWVGMWRGLRQKRPHLASLSAMLRVLGWPSVALFFLGVMATAAGPYAPWIMAVTVFAASNTLQTSAAASTIGRRMSM